MNNSRCAAIILAAGYSSRMGIFKPLIPLGEETVIERLISLFKSNGVDVFLITGWKRDELMARLKKQDVTIIDNPDFERGMFTSVQAGLRHLHPSHEAFFVMPADVPLVRPATIAQLMKAFSDQPDKIIYPVFKSRRGHPPLIPSFLAQFIIKSQDNGGLKAVLGTREEKAVEVVVPDSNILFDIDTPEDCLIMRERFQYFHVPTDEECQVILHDICNTAPDICRHCEKVSEVAVRIGEALNSAGQKIAIAEVRAAAALHDIAKGQPRHDKTGGNILSDMGFGKIGDMVAVHTDLPEESSKASLEARIVYLADKFVAGEKLIAVEERYQLSEQRFGLVPEAKAAVLQRKNRALDTKRELEVLLGYSLNQVVFQ